MLHEWTFMLGTSTIGAVGERVVAVCRRCGLIRTGRVAGSMSKEGRIDLRGDCPGEPQEPTEDAHGSPFASN
jgi:hypothetical protein